MTTAPPKTRVLGPRLAPSRTSPPSLTEIIENDLIPDTATGEIVAGEAQQPGTAEIEATLRALRSSEPPLEHSLIRQHAVGIVELLVADIQRISGELATAHEANVELRRYNRRLVGERDAALGNMLPATAFRISVYCDNPACDAAIALRPLPEDEATIWLIVRAARWTIVGEDHFCPACAKSKGI